MPKGTRDWTAPAGRQLANKNEHADFTVYDYANAEPAVVKSGRMSKAAANSFKTEAKQLTVSNRPSKENLAWYEQDLSDLELSDQESLEISEADNSVAEASSHGRRRRRKQASASESDERRVYPIDLWFLIGACVDPEDLCVFAGICRGSHVVTHTARFWNSMYKRCYNSESSLPRSLQPLAITRIHGLRSRVIRSLFFMHGPFQQRRQGWILFDNDPECLKGAMCTLMWHQNVKSHWHFFFKFLLHTYDRHKCTMVAASNRHLSPRDDVNIHHNPEARNCVLQIVTQNFIPFPPSIMGQHLAMTSLSVGHGMRYHKMKMTFTPQQYTTTGANKCPGGTTIVLDPVLNTYVLNWWDPKYPHQPT